MKINTISKLTEILNKTLPIKHYVKEAIETCEHIQNKKGKKFDKYC